MRKKEKILWMLSFVLLFCFPQMVSHAADTVSVQKEFYAKLSKNLDNRKKEFSIRYQAGEKEIHTLYQKMAKDLDDVLVPMAYHVDRASTSSDADYLLGVVDAYSIRLKNNVFYFKFQYHENSYQTKRTDRKVKKIIKAWKKLSDREKIKRVHDYLIQNLTFDSRKNSFHTAYDGLFKGKTVCIGYASLAYKMLTELKVPCKIVCGYVTDGKQWYAHAWNIVRTDGKWYCMDVTWDDLDNGRISYRYFLKGSKSFSKKHLTAKQYTTKEFKKKYPIVK